MKKFLLFIGLGLVGLILLQVSRGQEKNSSPKPLHVQPKERIVSLAPSITETLFELGLGDQIVGVTRYCTHPEQVKDIAKIGDFLNPNLEKIVSLKPTLIISEYWPSSKLVHRLKQLNLTVKETISPYSLAEVDQFMQQMGEITHQENQAKGVTQSMREKRLELEKRAKALPYRPSIYIEIDRPAWTVGKKSFVTEAISLCGARNIFEDVELNALQAASESIIDKNPEFILAFNTREEEIRKRPGWQGIQALRENKIIVDFPEELLSHGNHRLMIGMQKFQDELILRMSNNGKSTNP